MADNIIRMPAGRSDPDPGPAPEPLREEPRGRAEPGVEPPADTSALVAEAILTAVGLATIAAEATWRAVVAASGREVETPEGPATGAPMLLGAVLGATAWGARVVGTAVDTAGKTFSFVMGTFLDGEMRATERALRRLDERWRGERGDAERLADAVAADVLRRTADAALDRLDLTDLVERHIDIDALVDGVDIERIIARVDLGGVAARLDVNALAESIDLDRILARVDIDEVASRLDLDAVVDRLDLAALAREVLDAIDLPEIIRESTGSMASETVRSVRMQGIGADQAVSSFVDRVLLRKKERRTQGPAGPSDGPAPDETGGEG